MNTESFIRGFFKGLSKTGTIESVFDAAKKRIPKSNLQERLEAFKREPSATTGKPRKW
jgi:hypothetical protein